MNDLHDHEDEVLNNLLRSMLFLSSEPGNSRPDVAERLLSSLDQAQFSSLHNSIPVPVVIEDFKQIVREEHIGMFAAAYDTVWLAAAAFSRFSASGGTGCPQQADPSGLWSECLLSVSVAGASGNLSLDTDWSTTNTLHNLTFWQLDDSKSLTMIGIFSRDKSIITSVNGQAGIKWRDGSIFPPDRPRADVSAAENKAWMSGSLWVAVAVAAVLLVAFLGILFLYFQLRRTLSSISPSNLLDVESPLIKAADLLQELSRTFFLTRRLRTKALHTSLMLMGSEDVFAPDLVNQSEGVNKDILSFLTFANKTGYKGARSISYAADITVGKNKDTAVLATLPEQPHSEMTLNGSTKDLHLVSSANDEEVVNVVVPPAAAGCGTDLFFDSFANAAASGGQPILSVGMHALRHFGLIRRFHLDDEMLARFIKDIEAG